MLEVRRNTWLVVIAQLLAQSSLTEDIASVACCPLHRLNSDAH